MIHLRSKARLATSFLASMMFAGGLISCLSQSANASQPLYKFDFGPGKVAPGYTQVLPTTLYSDTRGYGFEPGFHVEGVSRGNSNAPTDHFCTSPRPFYFSVKLPEGNYRVTVTLGDPEASSTTTVKAELRRLMLKRVHTEKGQFATRTFTVNIRRPQISTGGIVHRKPREFTIEAWAWDDKMTIEFNNSRPCICSMEISKADKLPTVFLAGDSTVTDQSREPWTSWGQMLTWFFKPTVVVANESESGDSARSFIGQNRLKKIMSIIKPGDYLFIQFGHNDQKEHGPGVGPYTTYEAALKKMVTEAREHGAHPVLVTPMNRRTFNAEGKITNSLGNFPDAMRQLAKKDHVPLIDLNAMSKVFYEALGPQKAKLAFATVGTHVDGTHHDAYGAYELARCIVDGIREDHLPLAADLKDVPNFDPAHPDDVYKFHVPSSPMVSDAKPYGN